MNEHTERAATATERAEEQLTYALARMEQHDHLNAVAHAEQGLSYIRQAKRDLNLALIEDAAVTTALELIVTKGTRK